ncbi:MAG: hypothetical protein R6W78_15800 [Bacteroidales bacterium]
MRFLNIVFGNKTEEIELTKPKKTEYFIDIDTNSNTLSAAFKDFYQQHFINAIGLSRGEADTYFFNAMTMEEMEIAKRLIRFDYLNDKSGLVKAMALSKLNYVLTGQYEQKPKFDRDYFLSKRNDKKLLHKLFEKLENLDE